MAEMTGMERNMEGVERLSAYSVCKMFHVLYMPNIALDWSEHFLKVLGEGGWKSGDTEKYTMRLRI